MKHALAGIIALFIVGGLAASCGGSISTYNGLPGDEAGSQDGMQGCGGTCGGSSQTDATLDAGGDVAVADTASSPEAGDSGVSDATADSAGDAALGTDDAFSGLDARDAGPSDAADAGCAPGSTQCLGDMVQTCNASGQWTTACGCAGFCLGGSCMGGCTPGSAQCSGNAVQTCSGCAWGPAVACVNQACLSGACTGVCRPGRTQCSDAGLETCDPTGTWQSAASCDGGACDASAVACNGDAGQSD